MQQAYAPFKAQPRQMSPDAPITPVAIPSHRTPRSRPRRGFLLVRCEPCAFGLSEALGSLLRLEAQDRLVVIDGDNDGVSGRPRRIVARRDLNLEGHGPCPVFLRERSTDIVEQGGASGPSGRHVAKSYARKSLSQRRYFVRSVQLLEAVLSLEPKRGRFSMP